MNILSIISRLIAGAVLGVLFYLGLWLTVRELSTTRHPVLLALGSFWIRTLVVLAGFLFLLNGRWQFALLCALGFIMGRAVISKTLGIHTARTKCP